ncbi:MAG: hypothetical protein ACLTFB_02045 [Candidatus Phytoplasma pyri]|uniref:hypothetical protein n=1 Tax=Candidatus Phytoplasma pyri TaxID=47566 RepID=UPI003983856E
MQINLLKKVIIITLLFISCFIIEIFSKLTINSFADCHNSFFKIEFLPLILIGFLFGFKYGFLSNLLYLLIHFIFEYFYISETLFSSLDLSKLFIFCLFFFKFFLPYIYCSFSGLFYRQDLQHLNHKKNIILTFFIIVVLNIISVFLMVEILSKLSPSSLHNIEHHEHDKNLFKFFFSENIPFKTIYLIYNLLSVLVNYFIICLLFILIIPRLKDNLYKLS